MKKIISLLILLLLTIISLTFFNYKHSYYGFTKSFFIQTPSYLRPHFRGPDLGNRGFSIVRNDINLDVLGIHNSTKINNGSNVCLKKISGYYYTKENLIVEAKDIKDKQRLVLINYKNFEKGSFDLLNSIPKNEGYKRVVIPNKKHIFYTTNYLYLFLFIQILMLIVLLIRSWRKLIDKS